MSVESQALDYIADTIIRERFFEKVYEISQSESAVDTVKGHIANLDHYCKDVYDKETDDLIKEMYIYTQQSHSIRKVLIFLDDFQKWLQKDHPDIIIWKGRNHKAKLYLKRKYKTSVPSYFSSVVKYITQVWALESMR